MDVSGKPNEGWMTAVPVMVLLAVAIVVLGGPEAFAHTLNSWVTDILSAVVGWLKHL